MADAARPAHPAHPAGGGLLVTILSLGLAMMPLRAHAEPAPPTVAAPAEPEGASEPEGTADAAPDAAPDEADAPPPELEGDDGGEGPEAEAEAATGPEPEADADADAEAGDAKPGPTDVPAKPEQPAPGALGPTAAPLRPMQTAAWWTMFGAFAVGTTAGVLAGLAERQEDRATRLSTLFDAETGAQPLYADRKDEYEEYLRRGEGFAKAAIGVGIVAGVATFAAITVFAIDARRQRSGDATRKATEPPRRAAFRVRGGGMEVRF